MSRIRATRGIASVYGAGSCVLRKTVALVAATAAVLCDPSALSALELVKDGASPYQVVRSDSSPRTETRAAALLRDYLQTCGVKLALVTDREGNAVSEHEIVVGQTRRESPALFEFDRHTVGDEGFLIRVAGQRVFILGGAAVGTRNGVEYFLRTFCGYSGDPKTGNPLTALSLPADYEYRQRQVYAIAELRVASKTLDSYTIVAGDADLGAAEVLRGVVYGSTGIWLQIATTPTTGPAIVFSSQKPDRAGRFEIAVAGGNIVLRNDIPHGFERGVTSFFANEVRQTQGVFRMEEGFSHSRGFEGVVRYSEFGARGDGKTDDFAAIAQAHDFANAHGLPVQADEGATYYLGGADRTAVIQTDTDFGTARFVVDDTKVENRGANVFMVTSQQKSFKLEGVSSLKRNQEKISASLPGPCLVAVTNAKVKRYIRYGANQNKGSAQTDVFVADANGNVDMNAPIIWDFDEITDITAYPIDEKALTVRGGVFTTIANAEDSKYAYYGRGIAIRRSNVVVDQLEHRITGEGDHGAPYGGFINVGTCANVTVKNTVLTGHKTYRTIGSAGVGVSMGTYDISLNRAVNVSFINCTQTNDIKDGRYWGILGSNYCKNLLYDSCSLSRFDAHMGVANATIRNSTLGHAGINAIGCGTFTVEGSTVYGGSFINLRSDYGSTWEGEFVIRDCVFVPSSGRSVTASLIGGSNSGQHDFGYTCHMPAKITIDGLRIDDSNHPDDYQGPAIFGNFNRNCRDESYVEKFPYIRTREVVLKDVTTASGAKLRVSDNTFMFRDVKVTELPGE